MAAPLAAGTSLPELSPDAAISEFLTSLQRPMRLLVAISGGSDSTGLLVGLARALETQRFPHRHSLVAVTVDHGLRSASTEEARMVGSLCHDLGIPHRISRWTGEKPQAGLSAAARLARYHLLAEAANALAADAIVTGHTRDDQIETVTMRAGRAPQATLGLAGMADATLYDRHLWILRPFLHTRRAAIRDELHALGRLWIDDPSNEDTRYERVRTRKGKVSIDIARIEDAARRRRGLSAAAADWLTRHAWALPGPSVAITLDGSPSCPADIRDHALAALIAILGGKPHRPSADSFNRLVDRLDSGADFRLTLSGTLVLRRRDRLFLLRERRGLLPLPVPPGTRAVWDGRFEVENTGVIEVIVEAGPVPVIDPDLPGPVRAAMAGNAPKIPFSNGFSGNLAPEVMVKPRLSLFADFMPVFDQPVADAIGRLFGLEPTPTSPI